MIRVAEAVSRISQFEALYATEEVSLESAAGRILRGEVVADREYPAEDRSRMDGIAVDSEALNKGVRAFPILGMARAGEPRQSLGPHPDGRAGCFEIMTGASVPLGADCVVPYERISIAEGVATLASGVSAVAGDFVHKQGSDCARGEILVKTGERLSAVRIAAAASMGYSRLLVSRRPRITVLTTGDELVEVGEVPAAHQVRASNGHALRALLEGFGTVTLDSVGDDRNVLRDRLAQWMAVSDVLLITGGVSAGKFDEVPGVLKELGVTEVFHKVAQKPGKPLWFGTSGSGTLVFGLPGNPVSSLVCARRYVVPLLEAKSGHLQNLRAGTAPRVRFPDLAALPVSNLTRFIPVRLVEDASVGGRIAVPAAVNGSGDFSGLGRSEGFLEIPAGFSLGQSDGMESESSRPSEPKGELMAFFGWES